MVLAAHRVQITERGRRRVIGALVASAVLLVLYWAGWLLDRTLLASDTRPAYYEFEAAFALADGWLAFCLVAAARALAVLRGRSYCLPQDVQELARDVLRHRLVLTYQALAEQVSPDSLLTAVLAAIPPPRIDLAREQPA